MAVHKSTPQEKASVRWIAITITITVWTSHLSNFPSEFFIGDVGFLFYPNLEIHLSVFILIEFAFKGSAWLATRKKKRAAGEDQGEAIFHVYMIIRTQ
jgi:hypothetical protein